MKKILLFTYSVFFINILFAQTNTQWTGATNSTWSNSANWTAGVPGPTDTAIFNSSVHCDLDISPTIAALRTAGAGGNIVALAAPRSITIGPTATTGKSVLSVTSGTSLGIGFSGGFGISFSTYSSNAVTNTAQIDGSLYLGVASAWTVNNVTLTRITTVDISGNVNVISTHTGAAMVNSSIATVRFLSGSNLQWQRNGGNIPTADYQDGSTINVTGITTTMVSFSASANYNGLIIWNCAGQTISGSSAVLLPTNSYAMDSIRIINTGTTNTLRLVTQPNGYSIGQLEVQGGTLEMGAPVTTNVTGNIMTDLKIIGGTVIGNATYAGDGATASALTITVNGDVAISGGVFNLTNRSTLSTSGAFILNAKGTVAQTAGNITASSAFGSQNQINMTGTISQNLELDNITGPIGLVINNTGGVSLQNNMSLPSALVLFTGYLKVNNFIATVGYPSLIAFTNTKIVTNSTGALKITSMPASSSLVFPVALSATTYNAVTIAPSASASTNDYTVRVETGNNPSGIYNVSKTIDRTWYITPTTNIVSASVNLSFQYAATDVSSVACDPTLPMELGHFIAGSPGAWNLDPVSNATPTGAYIVGPFAPNSLGSAFVIGNVGSILAFGRTIELSAQKQNSKTHLAWTFNTPIDVRQLEIERSADAISFINLSSVSVTTTSFDDNKLLPGLNYYRIKITDFGGKVSYSSIVAILNKESGFDIIGLAPTLVTNNAVLNVTAAQKTKMDVVVTDITGKQVQKMAYNLIAGSNQFTINLENLSSGTYQINGYTTDGKSRTIRFVKQ